MGRRKASTMGLSKMTLTLKQRTLKNEKGNIVRVFPIREEFEEEISKKYRVNDHIINSSGIPRTFMFVNVIQ